MAIPISKYIDIKTVVSNDTFGDRDWSGLVFTKTAMKDGADKKTAYETNLNVVSLTKDEVAANFDNTTFVAWVNRYFAYSGGTKAPTHINIAFVGSDETASAAYSRVTNGTSAVEAFVNFGSFCFYDSSFTSGAVGDGGLLDVSIANEENAFGWVMMYGTNTTNQSADSAAIGSATLTHLTHDPVCPLAWYASVDYSVSGSAGTIDYKQFSGATATVNTATAKTTADGLKVNYIGAVQTYGNALSFYQTGVNMDGTDLGVVRDACWINSQIVKGYFNLQNSMQKVPANASGASMVRNIVIEANCDAISAGAILVDKPLTSTQIATINSYAGDTSAADAVASTGYYVSTSIVVSGGKYYCKYTDIYAKGDHISKVEGVHILV